LNKHLKNLAMQRFSFSWLATHLQVVVTVMCGVALVGLIGITPAAATSLYEIPMVSSDTWVLDKAEVLSRTNEGTIAADLKGLAEKTGFNTRIVTIRRLDYGETVQSFTDKLFEQWFPEPEEQANQTLLVLDSLTNNSAIRTGEKVNAVMPDDIAESIAQETLLVPLKEGDKYNQALLDVRDRLVAVLSGEADPGPPKLIDNVRTEGTFASREQTKSSNATIWVVGFLIVATVVPMATYYFYQYMLNR